MTRPLSALVIGNAKYLKAGNLKNPANDADDIAAKLETGGFTVTKKIDATHKEMDRALREFKRALKGEEVGLFFFAGHGVQIEGDNYLAATDTEVSDEIDAKHSALPLNRVIETMERAGTSTNIIILDACRDNPWDRAWRRPATSRGLAPVYAPKGTLIAFATSPGQVAGDGKARNGAYTAALLKHIDTPDCSIEMMFKRVRNTLSAATSQKQISWEHTSLSGEFYFNLSVGLRIQDYSATALSDSLFVLDDGKASHRLIRGLKSLTWPVQNPALEAFTAKDAEKSALDSLFVIGRNIYQAADGNSNAAKSYIENFPDRTNGLSERKRRALLDGILFEIFFDPKGQLRREPKVRRFNEVFRLQQFSELASSFEFIAECLVPYADTFYSIPGKSHAVAVDVTVEKGSNNAVKAVFVGGLDVLRPEDDDDSSGSAVPSAYKPYSRDGLEEKLSEEMLVPAHLLKFTYSEPVKDLRQLGFPYGFTIRKRVSDS